MLAQIRAQFDQQKIDALFVSNKSNIFYLTGFKASNVFALITRNNAYIFTDARYIEKAKNRLPEGWKAVNMAPAFLTSVHKLLATHRVKAFGVEQQSLTVNLYELLKNLGTQKLVLTDNIIERVRMIKNDSELRNLRQSQRVNEQVLKLLLKHVKVGVTETDLVWRLKQIAHDLGASDVSFDPIICFGAHSSMPHHEVTAKRKLRKGDMVLIDMGVIYKDMCSDMTRTFFTKVPNRHQAMIYETVLRAQEAGMEIVGPGRTAGEVDHACRHIITQAGHGDKFTHSTGHGIGIDVHETPFARTQDKTILETGMVITVEPGVYLPGKFGVRIEDMIEVTDKAGKSLNKFPKALEDVILKIA